MCCGVTGECSQPFFRHPKCRLDTEFSVQDAGPQTLYLVVKSNQVLQGPITWNIHLKCGICVLLPEYHSNRLFLKHFPFLTTASSIWKYTLLHCVALPSYTASRSEVGSLTRVLYWGSLPSIVARNWKTKILKCCYDQKLTMASFKSIIILFMSTGSAINAFVAYGGWVPRNMGDWNCWSQTQTARTPKSPPYLQPSHEPILPEQPFPSPCHTELEDQWKKLLSK